MPGFELVRGAGDLERGRDYNSRAGLTDPGDPGGRYAPNDAPPRLESADDGDANIIKRIKETYEYEKRVRQPHQMIWDKALDRINGYNPLYAKKAPYQSRRMLPIAAIMSFTYAWEFQKQIELAGRKWFELEAVNSTWKPITDFMRDWMLTFLHPGGAKPKDEFLTFVFDSIFMSISCQSMHALVLPENEGYVDTTPTLDQAMEADIPDPTIPSYGFGAPDPGALPTAAKPPVPTNQPFGIRIEAMHPRYMYLDSSNSRNMTYKAWVQSMKPGQFRAEAKVAGWKNVDEVIKAKSRLSSVELDRSRDARDKQETAEAKRLDTINLLHFFGTLFDSDGEVIFENKYCIISGDYIVYGPVENPLWHGQIPIVSSGLLRKPFTTYHESLLTLNLDPIDSRVEVMNALLDYMNWAINPPTEVDWDQLHQSRGNQLQAGVYPGMLLHLQKQNKNYPALNRMQMQSVGSDVWQALGLLKQEWQEYLGMAGSASMPRTRNRITADEAKERMAQAAGIIEQIFKNFQHNYLEPVLYQAFLCLLQKCPQDLWASYLDEKIKQYEKDPATAEILTGMKSWNAMKRFQMLGSAFRLRVTVYSAAESRRSNIEKLNMLTEAAGAMPGLAQRIKWQKVGEEYARNLELDPTDFLHPDEGATAEQPYNAAAAEGGQPPPQVPGTPNPVGNVTPPPKPR